MDGMLLNDKVRQWISSFSTSLLERDSLHVDEFIGINIPKKYWIDYAWRCYHHVVSECATFDKIHVVLVFYLNTTHSARPFPKLLNRQLFNTIATPPEIFLIKNFRSDFFIGDIRLLEMGEQYSLSCYYSEIRDDSDHTYWHYLYFTDK